MPSLFLSRRSKRNCTSFTTSSKRNPLPSLGFPAEQEVEDEAGAETHAENHGGEAVVESELGTVFF